MRKVIRKGDALLDLGKLKTSSKVLLFPILVKIFGLVKAFVLLYGSKK